MEDSMQCRNCGAPADFDQRGPFLSLEDTDSPALNDLFAGRLDEARCAVCGNGLGFSRTIAVHFSDPPDVVIALGDLLKQQATTAMPPLRAEIEKLAVRSTIELESAEALR